MHPEHFGFEIGLLPQTWISQFVSRLHFSVEKLFSHSLRSDICLFCVQHKWHEVQRLHALPTKHRLFALCAH